MRSGTTCNINSGQVYSWASGLLLDAKLVKDHGWKCSAAIVLGITTPRLCALHLAERRLPRLGPCTIRAGRAYRIGRRLVQNVDRFGTAIERRFDRPVAQTHAPSGMEHRHRLALAALLRRALPKPQRTLLRQTQTGNHEVSCLCLGLHRGTRTTLHVGADLGAPSRVDGSRIAADSGQNPRNWPENQAYAARPGVFQRGPWWRFCTRKNYPS